MTNMDWDRVARERNLSLPSERDDIGSTKPMTLKRLTWLLRQLGYEGPPPQDRAHARRLLSLLPSALPWERRMDKIEAERTSLTREDAVAKLAWISRTFRRDLARGFVSEDLKAVCEAHALERETAFLDPMAGRPERVDCRG